MTKERVSDFRWVFTNGFGLQITDNEVMLTFGMVQDPAKPNESVLEQVGCVMSPRSAKLLARILTDSISNWEKTSNFEIKLGDDKIKEIEAVITSGTNKTKDAAT
jgi:hypothetical protein